jgi:hypothetical protein
MTYFPLFPQPVSLESGFQSAMLKVFAARQRDRVCDLVLLDRREMLKTTTLVEKLSRLILFP